MKIKLYADYRGVLTNERFYPAGELDVDDAIAGQLVEAGRAEYINPPAPEPEQPTKITKRTRK
jgi:hypothetical protein